MNFADLQVFKSVVDEGGVIRAASKLHRVPSAVTTRIKQLEASMGVKLFHRDKQRLHLSPAGELLLDYAERLIQLSEEARDVVTGTTPRGVKSPTIFGNAYPSAVEATPCPRPRRPAIPLSAAAPSARSTCPAAMRDSASASTCRSRRRCCPSTASTAPTRCSDPRCAPLAR